MSNTTPQSDASRWEEVASQLLSLYDYSQNDDSPATSRTVMNAFRDAFAQVAAEAREEAALAVETMPSTGFLAAKRIRALKSPTS